MKKTIFAVLMLFAGISVAQQVPMLFYGEASWYGGKFQGRRTANGEIFDTNKMTAAHKTLPFGTMVRVVNLANEKKVVVRINDRGPFVKNRVLDLSRAAAKKLAFELRGTAKVEVRVLKLGDGKYKKVKRATVEKTQVKQPQIQKRTPVKNKPFRDTSIQQGGQSILRSSVASGSYIIQAAAFSSKQNALKYAQKIRNSGLSSFVYASGSSTFFRVWVGPFQDKKGASVILEQVRKIAKSAFIKKV